MRLIYDHLSVGQQTAKAAASVECFLSKLYWNVGETLPHEFLLVIIHDGNSSFVLISSMRCQA